jgi:hypothetical protein
MDINHAMICPVDARPFTGCPCVKYSKQGLCDWPFSKGMTVEEMKKLRGELNVNHRR